MSETSVESFFSLSEFPYSDVFDGCKHVWDVLKKISTYLQATSLGKIEVDLPPGVYIDNPKLVSIGKGSVVESGAYIQGPCLIGRSCEIRQGAYIRGNVIAGDHCVIGHASEIKNSILLNHAHAPHFNYVGDSILGNRINLGAGVICANLRLDKETVKVMVNGKKYDTLLKKLGLIIGDDASIGCNAVTNPGTILGKGAMIFPCQNIGGYIPPGSIGKRRK